MDRLDDQFRDMDSGWQRDDRCDDLADIAGTKNQLPLLLGYGNRSLLKDGCVDFSWVDVRDSDPLDADFVGHARTECGHCEFAGGISDSAESQSPLSGNARDIDDGSAVAFAHFGERRVDHVVGTRCIDGHDFVPLFRAHLADRTVLDVHSCGIDQDIDRVPLLAHLIDEVLDARAVGHIEGKSDNLGVA